MPVPKGVEWDYVAWNEVDFTDAHVARKVFQDNVFQDTNWQSLAKKSNKLDESRSQILPNLS